MTWMGASLSYFILFLQPGAWVCRKRGFEGYIDGSAQIKSRIPQPSAKLVGGPDLFWVIYEHNYM